MTIEHRNILHYGEWLEWRQRDVTASDVAAVFDLHPFKTRLDLWLEKTGVARPKSDSAVMKRGRIMEPSVAAAVALDRPDWKLVKCNSYFTDTTRRLGATPDFWIEGDPRGLGVLQAKTASPKSFAKHFSEDTPPFWIVLQNQTEVALTEVAFGAVAVLIVDAWKAPDVHVYDVPRSDGAIRKIKEGVAEFWKAVEAGTMPTADYSRDAALISTLFPSEVPGTEIDLTADNLLPGLLEERAALKATATAAKERAAAIDAELKMKMGTHESAILAGGWRAKWRVEPRPERLVAASEPRVLRVKKAKESS